MKNMKKIVLCILCFCLLSASLTGCGGSNTSGKTFRYDISSKVTNLDPQYATDQTAQMIICNIFEGLLRQDAEGKIHPAVATSYDVSADGMLYTFALNPEAIWSDETPLTADDFVFAFRRMFSSSAPSPFATDFQCLQNAAAILSGKLPETELGVIAKEPYILEIRLDYANPLLPELLASAAAMPSNEHFFQETKGRYGLEEKFLNFNGPFAIKSWNNEKSIVLKANEKYRSQTPVIPASVYLYINRPDPIGLYFSDRSDASKIPFDRLPAVTESGGTYQTFEDTVWVVVYNQRNPVLANANVRRGLSSAIDRSLFSADLPGNLTPTEVLIPSAVKVMGENHRSSQSEQSSIRFDVAQAKQYFYQGLQETQSETLPVTELLVVDSPSQSILAGYVQQNWQKHLSTYLNMNVQPLDTVLSKINQGAYEIAIIPLSASYSNPLSILSQFHTQSNLNFTGFSHSLYDQMLSQASTSTDIAVAAYKQAETTLIDMGVVAPLYFESSYYAMGKGVSGIEFSPFGGRVSFKNASKPD